MSDTVPVFIEWPNSFDRRQIVRKLDQLALSADAKILMGELLETTTEVAARLCYVGRSIVAFVFDLTKRFTNTTLGVLVGMTVTALVGSIPLLGIVLSPLVGPLLAAFTITAGALADMRNGTMDRQIELFSAKLDAALSRA
ncbi:hypothetical protein [Novosphingobium taihuense]|uniref:Uncharacterized protein n=1 Tax=Novosphingobium taihuense TaxID=260085 RepID=A0A7W7EW61_9SPHN|nr:hypothetical protein [Novosphingobium taihuense]MBB4615754.1 hypothetical protein [Novosphingobium taihuense]TWH79708.1 hypothetical protein IQ25_03919 [Novosphingobium taihuense]